MCFVGNRGHYRYAVDALKYLPELEVSAVSAGCNDDITNLLSELSKNNIKPRIYDNSKLMIDDIHPDIVCVSGQFEKHAEFSNYALSKGIHVFCEKPVALKLSDLEALKKTYESVKGNSVQFTSMLAYRHEPIFINAAEMIANGEIGEIKMITTQKSYIFGNRPDYYKQRSTYGGTIPWIGIHQIDWIYWFGKSKFKSVFASHRAEKKSNSGEIEMTALFIFEMQNGIIASGNCDFLRPTTAPSHGDDRVRVAGSEGILEIIEREISLINAEGVKKISFPEQAFNPIFLNFVNAIQGNERLAMSPEETFYVTEVCLLARESADTNKIIRLTD